jgi:hypothetical protein
MNKTIFLIVFLAGMLVFSAGTSFSRGLQQRIPQPIVINGQQTEGVTIVQNGTVQTVNCPSPRPYTTADVSSSGWACFDESTGTWLLHALPPQSSGAYPNGAPGFYYDYPDAGPYYPYGYYPYDYYPYGFLGGPVYGFGGGHEFYDRHGKEYEHGGGHEGGHGGGHEGGHGGGHEGGHGGGHEGGHGGGHEGGHAGGRR